MDNLLNSDDVHYMLGALRTLGLKVEEQSENKRVIVEGCGGKFPVGNGSAAEVQLFLGNAGTAMRPLTAAVTAAGGNARLVKCSIIQSMQEDILIAMFERILHRFYFFLFKIGPFLLSSIYFIC